MARKERERERVVVRVPYTERRSIPESNGEKRAKRSTVAAAARQSLKQTTCAGACDQYNSITFSRAPNVCGNKVEIAARKFPSQLGNISLSF